jgi:fructokinase
MSDQIWIVGEVLIDLISDKDDYIPIVGGGPANTAKALARLGIKSYFIGGISTDKYGQMVKAELLSDKILLDYIKFSKKPTCTAKVVLSSTGKASYEFVIENTATFDFSSSWLPEPNKLKPKLLYIGTLATAIEPGATALFEWAKSVSKVAPIVFDPNIRPTVISDREQYVAQVERWVAISSAVKVSDEDIKWLYPSIAIEKVVGNWLTKSSSLIVVTYGDKGLVGYRVGEKVSVDAVKVKVADTIGAGDTVGAILVEAIVKDGLASLTGSQLETMLKRSAKAAAITVSRIGANPPTVDELE